MSTGPGGWFEQLEAQLERQLETFLAANPAQEALLQEQELQEKQQRLKRRRLELQGLLGRIGGQKGFQLALQLGFELLEPARRARACS